MGNESKINLRIEPYLRSGFHFREGFANAGAETGVAVTAHFEKARFSLAPNFSMAGDIKRAGVCGLGAAKLLLPFTAGLCGDFNFEDHSLEPKLVVGVFNPPPAEGERNASVGLFFAVHDLTEIREDGASVMVGLSGRI